MTSETQRRAENKYTFRPRGYGRFLGAMFLSVWLCGWALGEAFALLVLGHGIWSLLTGCPAIGSDEPVRLASALGVGAFLLVWLTIWTLGGVMAMRELLRSLWAEDSLVLERDALVCLHRLGPITFRRSLARTDIRRVFIQPATTALMAQLSANVVDLTDLGTPAERSDAAERLRVALGLPEQDATAWPAALPEDWQEATGPRGEPLLVPNLRNRRKQAVVVAIVTVVVWICVLLLARESLGKPILCAVTLVLTVFAAWLVRQTLWMFRGRIEWRIAPGQLIHQRRCATEVTECAQARALELVEASDSDSTAYELRAIELSLPGFARVAKVPDRVTIERSTNDPTAPRCLGLWLSNRAGIPFHDRVPDEAAKQVEIARLKEQLASSGMLGRFVVRLLDHTKRMR